ncbi:MULTISPECIES: universal stress protein [Paraburkholderia]|nr:universal stress protein [Paraburkholderia bryophila]
MYHKILLAVDGSDASIQALHQALDVATLAQASLHAVYVVQPWQLSPYAGYYDPEALRKVLREDARTALDIARAAMSARGVKGTTEIVEAETAADDIASCLQRCAQRHGAELVAMGTHGRHGVKRAMLGSVAEQFLRISTCPVLLVRSREDAGAAGAEADEPARPA